MSNRAIDKDPLINEGKIVSKKHKLNIVFYVNGMPFDGNSLKTQSLGGSETAGLCMAREMAARGHDVTMFCNCKVGLNKINGVMYLPMKAFHQYSVFTDIDVLIVQRIPAEFTTRYKSKINILWNHDLALKRGRQDIRGSLWNIDEVWGLSDFHINQMSKTYILPKNVFWKTRNGIDPVALDPAIERNPKRIIYTSRPERGMDILLRDIMPKIWDRDKDIELVIAGYNNYVEHLKGLYDLIDKKINEYRQAGFKVTHKGPLTKEQLYREYQEASLYIYPSLFEEISCITVMECMANGLPLVGMKRGALPETLPNNAGVLLPDSIDTEERQNDFANTVMSLLGNPESIEKLRNNGIKEANKCLWSDVAEEWEAHFYEMFERLNDNPKRLAKHLWRTEDIIALKELNLPEWNSRIDETYSFIGDKKKFKKKYDSINKQYISEIPKNPKTLKLMPVQKISIDTIKGDIKPGDRLLDFGGSIGNEAILFANNFGCNVTTIDINPDIQTIGKGLAAQTCQNPGNIKWITSSSPSDADGSYDVIFCGEVLEHITDPYKLINDLEKKCYKYGKMVFTVPFGPWGDNGLKNHIRQHLWNFSRQDLKDIFSQKKNISIKLVAGGQNEFNKENQGWYVISYTNMSGSAEKAPATENKPFDTPISIIVPTINTDRITKFIREIKKSSKGNHEIIIIANNGCIPKGKLTLDSPREITIDDCRIIFNGDNNGWTKSINQGIEEASHDYIAIANDDIFLTDNWDQKLIGLMKKHNLRHIAPNVYGRFDHVKDEIIQGVESTFFIVEKELLQKTGGFDDRFFLHYADWDFYERMWDAKISTNIAPSVQGIHCHSASRQDVGIEFNKYHKELDRKMFDSKWKDRPDVLAKHEPIENQHKMDDYVSENRHNQIWLTHQEKMEQVIKILKENNIKNIVNFNAGFGNESIIMAYEGSCHVSQVIQDISFYQNKAYISEFDGKNLITGTQDLSFVSDCWYTEDPKVNIKDTESVMPKGNLLVFVFSKKQSTKWQLLDGESIPKYSRKEIDKIFVLKEDVNIQENDNWIYVWYRYDPEFPAIELEYKTGKVDMQRKLDIIVPRETISTCMIIGGNQEGLLHRCLKSVYSVSDEIIIADTGMSKNSLEIVSNSAYKDKITIIPNAPDPLHRNEKGEYDAGFSVARNFGLKHAKSDWILWIDSDEELLQNYNIFKYLRNNYYNGYSIRQHHFSADPPGAFKEDLPIRLFRNHKNLKFWGMIHEHPEIEINKSVGETTVLSDVNIAHDGYLTEAVRRERFYRNIGLMLADRKQNPHRKLGMFLMMRDWIHLAKYKMQLTKGQTDQEITGWCNETVEMYKNNFLGEDMALSSDGLLFYSEALCILGKGNEYSFNMDIRQMNSELNGGGITARFDTLEDFHTYVSARIKAQAEPFEGQYV